MFRNSSNSRNMMRTSKESSSEQEHKVNALASGADEGRDKLRKAAGSCKWATIRRYPNVETLTVKNRETYTEYIGIRGEPPELKHLSRERKRNQTRFRE